MNLHELITKQRQYYKSIRFIYSKALKSNVYFTSEGFNHLLRKSSGDLRPIIQSLIRICLLKDAVKIISLQEITSVRTKIDNEFEINYYAQERRYSEDFTVRTIVKRINKGKYRFLSVIPIRKAC